MRLMRFLSRLAAVLGITVRYGYRRGNIPEDRDDLLPDDWEINYQDDEIAEVETDWGWSTIYLDEDAARHDGYDPDSANYRGLFFAVEDAEEYARTIGLPVVFVATEAGIEVYIDYR